jgi:hypothetical protein
VYALRLLLLAADGDPPGDADVRHALKLAESPGCAR